MASQYRSNAALPQGFSVYQPTLGAQLQFFPALGSQELDDMINAFIPGPASIRDKRASITLDFFEYAQLTGRNFKFYTISPATPPTACSSSSSSSSPTATISSFSAHISAPWQSPYIPQVATASPISSEPSSSSSSSSSPTLTRKSPKAGLAASSSSSHSRPAPTDFAHLPGMKIMTKDGLDVTNSASRGSKTKEQRDHAHLMRIIKACDTCRRKKIRCDPSHKKRSASQAQSPRGAIAKPVKPAKKPRTAAVQKPSVAERPATDDAFRISQALLPFEPTFSFAHLDSLDNLDSFDPLEAFDSLDSFDSFVGADGSLVSWDDLLQYPPVDMVGGDYQFLDVGQFAPSSSQSPSTSSPGLSILSQSPSASSLERSISCSSQSPSSASQISDSPLKSLDTRPDQNLSFQIPDPTSGLLQGTDATPQLPYLDPSSSSADYTDFNLFSPGSSASSSLDDEMMIPISSHRHLGPLQSQSQDSQSQAQTGSGPGDGFGLRSGFSWSISDNAMSADLSSDGTSLGAMPDASTPLQSSPRHIGGEHLSCHETLFATSPRESQLDRPLAGSHHLNDGLTPFGHTCGDPHLSNAPHGGFDMRSENANSSSAHQSSWVPQDLQVDSSTRSRAFEIEGTSQPSLSPHDQARASRSAFPQLPSQDSPCGGRPTADVQHLGRSPASPSESCRVSEGVIHDQPETNPSRASATSCQMSTSQARDTVEKTSIASSIPGESQGFTPRIDARASIHGTTASLSGGLLAWSADSSDAVSETLSAAPATPAPTSSSRSARLRVQATQTSAVCAGDVSRRQVDVSAAESSSLLARAAETILPAAAEQPAEREGVLLPRAPLDALLSATSLILMVLCGFAWRISLPVVLQAMIGIMLFGATAVRERCTGTKRVADFVDGHDDFCIVRRLSASSIITSGISASSISRAASPLTVSLPAASPPAAAAAAAAGGGGTPNSARSSLAGRIRSMLVRPRDSSRRIDFGDVLF